MQMPDTSTTGTQSTHTLVVPHIQSLRRDDAMGVLRQNWLALHARASPTVRPPMHRKHVPLLCKAIQPGHEQNCAAHAGRMPDCVLVTQD
jgi:hypothetical protein